MAGSDISHTRTVRVALLLLCVVGLVLLTLAHLVEVRGRAEGALGEGMPEREAELARGFVLGQDDGIDAATVEDFRRAGLSHLLAVSGQNVALLVLLAMPALALLGIPLRARLVWVLALIACYVPLAGAGPSIQRAAVMGGLSVLATIAGRRASTFYALALAVIVTLAIDPAIAGDVGWQLSFAAVLGILLLSTPLAALFLGLSDARGPLARALCEGAAMTIAATLATAPLIAFHFGEVSTVALLANLLVLPAVAPAMWLGMLAAAAGQLPGLPVAALNALNAPLLAYIAQVASWCARPGWASVEVRLGSAGLLVAYLGVTVASVAALRFARRQRLANRKARRRRPRAPRPATEITVGLVAIGLVGLLVAPQRGTTAPPISGLRVSVLDVDQGDAILFQPQAGQPVLVDSGPPGQGLAGLLDAAGVERLGALVLTHDQSDHAGGVEEVLDAVPVGSLLHAAIGRRTLLSARAAGVPARRVFEGAQLRAGALRLDVIWPPPELLGAAAPMDRSEASEDPNRLALVMLAHWRDFSMLLCADAEAEAAPLDPGPVDVLKVAHHGSEDAGLAALLDRTEPRLAVISVGAENPYGHPTAATLASLAQHGVRTLRTDEEGTVVLDVHPHSIAVSTGN
jgi:competence protein ComEC